MSTPNLARGANEPDKLENLKFEVADHLEEICKLFTQRPKITIVIRTPWLVGQDGDVILSDDDFDLAIAAINRLRERTPA